MRVVVVGAGVVGLCCAWFLRRDGHDVWVVDRGGLDGDRCSLGNAGIIVPSHFVPLAAPGMVAAGLKMMAKRSSPFRIKPSLDPALAKWCMEFMKHCTAEHVDRCAPILRDMHLESKRLFLDFDEKWGHSFGLAQKGMLMLCRSEEGLSEEVEVAERARELGLRAEVLDPAQISDVEPGISVDVLGAVHFLDDCHVEPHIFVRQLQSRLQEAGVKFVWNQEVNDLSAGRLDLGQTVLEHDVAVLACGSWTGHLAKTLGLNVPLQPGKGLHFTAQRPPQSLQTAALLKEARIAVTPMSDGVRFAGTMELGEWSHEPDPLRAKAMAENIAPYLPDFPASLFEGQTAWTGLRPCSPDGMPYVGASRKLSNVFFATGHGMMGLSLGPVTGKTVADVVDGKAQTSALLSPDRFD